MLTKEGENSSIFRFFADKQRNEKFLQRRASSRSSGTATACASSPASARCYAEHPTDTGPDGRKAPLLVLGRFGGGRTLFSAIDDSWRWRFYTGE